MRNPDPIQGWPSQIYQLKALVYHFISLSLFPRLTGFSMNMRFTYTVLVVLASILPILAAPIPQDNTFNFDNATGSDPCEHFVVTTGSGSSCVSIWPYRLPETK